MAELGEQALVDVRAEATRARLRFAAGPRVRERVDAIVTAESQCCAFLTLRVDDEPDVVVLAIEAPPGAEPVLAEMVDASRRRSLLEGQ